VPKFLRDIKGIKETLSIEIAFDIKDLLLFNNIKKIIQPPPPGGPWLIKYFNKRPPPGGLGLLKYINHGPLIYL